MIAGTVILEDVTITFDIGQKEKAGLANIMVCERARNEENTEHCVADAYNFLCALSIAIHPEGAPNVVDDYPAAERAMGKIRWIP